MTDFEITRLCAQWLGYTEKYGMSVENGKWVLTIEGDHLAIYDPLTNKDQAMMLLESFKDSGLKLLYLDKRWLLGTQYLRIVDKDLARAICKYAVVRQKKKTDLQQ